MRKPFVFAVIIFCVLSSCLKNDPPEVTDYSVTPSTVARGGEITIKALAKDKRGGIAEVHLKAQNETANTNNFRVVVLADWWTLNTDEFTLDTTITLPTGMGSGTTYQIILEVIDSKSESTNKPMGSVSIQ